MGQRSDLQILLISLLGSNNVYFQPPANVQMEYPCIVYERSNVDLLHADNRKYRDKTGYQVTVIDHDPDSLIPQKVLMLPYCSFDRFFAVENLNHDIFTLFF